MKKRILLFAVALLAAFTSTAAALQHEQQLLSEKLIRLHVVANSDGEEDQQIKLKVRDAVLAVTQKASCKEDILLLLPEIQAAAEECLKANGCSHSVQTVLRRENFPTRNYRTFSLPAGSYTALRVTLGEGKGHNWWCVAFPSICLRAAADLEEAAQVAGFADREMKLITQEENYVLKFKALELLQRFKEQILQ